MLSIGLNKVRTHTIGSWAWIYNTAETIRQDANAGTDAKVLEVKLALN